MKTVLKVMFVLVLGATMMVTCPDEGAHRMAIDGRIANDAGWINKFSHKFSKGVVGEDAYYKDVLNLHYRNFLFFSMMISNQRQKVGLASIGVFGRVFVP